MLLGALLARIQIPIAYFPRLRLTIPPLLPANRQIFRPRRNTFTISSRSVRNRTSSSCRVRRARVCRNASMRYCRRCKCRIQCSRCTSSILPRNATGSTTRIRSLWWSTAANVTSARLHSRRGHSRRSRRTRGSTCSRESSTSGSLSISRSRSRSHQISISRFQLAAQSKPFFRSNSVSSMRWLSWSFNEIKVGLHPRNSILHRKFYFLIQSTISGTSYPMIHESLSQQFQRTPILPKRLIHIPRPIYKGNPNFGHDVFRTRSISIVQ